MPDEDKDPKPDQPETPEPAPEAEPDQPPAPETTEPEKPSPTGEEVRFTQAVFTKLTQDYAERFRVLNDKLDQALATRGGDRMEAEPETPENPQVEKILRGTKVFQEMESRNRRLEQTVASLAETTVTQALQTQFPDLKEDMPEFIGWIRSNPALASAIQGGGLSEKAVIAAYRAEHPAKNVRARIASSAPAKPAPPRVEGSSRPSGIVRDIRDTMREKGHKGPISIESAFDEAIRLEGKSG